jgi:hypothetical protein
MRGFPVCLLVLALGAARPLAGPPASGSSDASAAAAAALLDRFLARDEEPLTRYVGTRCLEATSERFKVTGSMQVTVQLSPERGFEWTVVSEAGSGYVRNKVLRKTLEGEREMVARGEPGRAAVSRENYEIGLRAPEAGAMDGGFGTLRLQITPRRRDTLLVHGSVLLTDPEAELLEVQGQLAKSPSWWTKEVHVVRTYGRVGGVRVPVAMSSTAQVRFAGRSQFRMTNVYEHVNGRATGTPVPAGYCTTTTTSLPAGPTPPTPTARTRT